MARELVTSSNKIKCELMIDALWMNQASWCSSNTILAFRKCLVPIKVWDTNYFPDDFVVFVSPSMQMLGQYFS